MTADELEQLFREQLDAAELRRQLHRQGVLLAVTEVVAGVELVVLAAMTGLVVAGLL